VKTKCKQDSHEQNTVVIKSHQSRFLCGGSAVDYTERAVSRTCQVFPATIRRHAPRDKSSWPFQTSGFVEVIQTVEVLRRDGSLNQLTSDSRNG
jgi:hypothetical protein